MSIITEEMRYHKRVVKYAIKYNNNALSVRRYYISKMQVKRWWMTDRKVSRIEAEVMTPIQISIVKTN